MIAAWDIEEGFPVYFRLVTADLEDASFLKEALNEINSFGIKIDELVVDGGYHSAAGIRKLNEFKIPFILRTPNNGKLYKELVTRHLPDETKSAGPLRCLKRDFILEVVGKKRSNLRAYVVTDVEKKNREIMKHLIEEGELELNFLAKEDEYKLKTAGVFVLISNADLSAEEVISAYRRRRRG
ncbi:MAG: transposase [Deltaproteobacteria bacterium]|nr:transposase [Deltaproteobacteria bacterium]